MAELGSFGDIVFEVGDEQLRTFFYMSQRKRGRYSTLNVANHEQLLQYDGRELQEVNFSMQFHHRFCDPQAEIEALRQMVDDHEAHLLIVGGYLIGEFVLEEMSSDWDTVANNGVIMMATGRLQLREYR